jgi:hypothetical protein
MMATKANRPLRIRQSTLFDWQLVQPNRKFRFKIFQLPR